MNDGKLLLRDQKEPSRTCLLGPSLDRRVGAHSCKAVSSRVFVTSEACPGLLLCRSPTLVDQQRERLIRSPSLPLSLFLPQPRMCVWEVGVGNTEAKDIGFQNRVIGSCVLPIRVTRSKLITSAGAASTLNY